MTNFNNTKNPVLFRKTTAKQVNYSNWIVLLVFFCLISLQVNASDLAREKRMASEIVDAILDGDAVYLKAGEVKFLGIYTESAKSTSKGTVIILHGRGFHPDWQDTVNPLRVGLTESGWNTLAVQMPVLQKQAKYYDYVPLFPQAVPRIESSIAFARKQLKEKTAIDKVVLVAHSCGAHMAMAWVDAESTQAIDAYVGLGMGATDYRQPMRRVFPLEKLNIPVLDVYAENDYPAVIKMAPQRLAMIIAAGNNKSEQKLLTDADHYYIDQGEELTQLISHWLDTI